MLTWSSIERGACMLLGTIHIALGTAVLVGGPPRFPPPNYTPLVEATNGEVWPYGSAWILGGLIMLIAPGRWRLIGIGIIILISNVWAALFAVGAYVNPTASFTPTVAYGGYGIINACVGALMWMHSRRKHGDE